MTNKADVIIIGGGLIGLTQALALSAHGITSHVIDRADPATMLAAGFDGRTSAISSSSMKMFEAIGIRDQLADKGCPIKQIWVSDGLKPGALDFVPSAEDGYLGQMFENRFLRSVLYNAARESDAITLHMPVSIASKSHSAALAKATLETGEVLTADLMIVAEGRQSETRDEAGIKIGNMATALWSARFSMKSRMAMSLTRFSIPPGRSRCCRCATAKTVAIAPLSSGR
jgi:2-octaprenyl-6-methoxyphenol hydroxylase